MTKFILNGRQNKVPLILSSHKSNFLVIFEPHRQKTEPMHWGLLFYQICKKKKEVTQKEYNYTPGFLFYSIVIFFPVRTPEVLTDLLCPLSLSLRKIRYCLNL